MIPSNPSRFSHQHPLIANPQLAPAIDLNRMMLSSKKLENINCIFSPSDSLGGLYLGDVVSTLKQDLLKNNNIRAILTCMCQRVSINPIVNCHKILPIKDVLQYPIIHHFDDAVAWIDQKRKEKYNVLVHCHAGVSRSVTIIIAYLIRTQNWNPFQAFEFVKQQRERAKPNASFWNQINEYYNYWSRHAGMHLQSQASLNSTKENNSIATHQPHKMASQQVLSGRNDLLQEKQKKKQEPPIEKALGPIQKVNIGVEKMEKQIDKNKQQKQKVSISRRKKIFQRPLLNKVQPEKTKTEEIISQYYINAPKMNNSIIKPHANSHLHQSSIIVEQSRFSENKSTLQPRNSMHSESLMKSRNEQPALTSGRSNFRPEIKFSQRPAQNTYLSPFDAHSIIRFP